MTRSVRCPTCDQQVPWTAESRWRPFCSQRCKDIDLGAWASNNYSIAGKPEESTPSSDDFSAQ